MGEIHELFVLGLVLVWFAGATPDWWVACLHFSFSLEDFNPRERS